MTLIDEKVVLLGKTVQSWMFKGFLQDARRHLDILENFDVSGWGERDFMTQLAPLEIALHTFNGNLSHLGFIEEAKNLSAALKCMKTMGGKYDRNLLLEMKRYVHDGLIPIRQIVEAILQHEENGKVELTHQEKLLDFDCLNNVEKSYDIIADREINGDFLLGDDLPGKGTENDGILTSFLYDFENFVDKFDNLLELLEVETESEYPEIKREIIAELHSIKGSAGTAEFFGLRETLHNIETLFEDGFGPLDRVKKLRFTRDAIDECQSSMQDFFGHAQPKTMIKAPRTAMMEMSSPRSSIQSVQKAHSKIGNRIPMSIRLNTNTAIAISGNLTNAMISGRCLQGELEKVSLLQSDIHATFSSLRRRFEDISIQTEGMILSGNHGGRQHDHWDPLELDRFSDLQEQTRMTAELINDLETAVNEIMQRSQVMNRHLVEQQELISHADHALMRERMVSFTKVTRRLEKTLESACEYFNYTKKADLVIRCDNGFQVENQTLTSLVTALEHLIRNALAHGIETIDERLKKGKKPEGRIIITILQKNNDIEIEVEDDGRGIDYRLIQQKAVERNFIDADKFLTQEEALDIIFSPGFSTVDVVNQQAGRGVGLDTVRADLAKAGGWIRVLTDPECGTTFKITVPACLSLLNILPVVCEGYCYGIPTTLIKAVHAVSRDTLEMAYRKEEIVIEGNTYPVYPMNTLMLGDRCSSHIRLKRTNMIFLIESDKKTVAYHVERGEQDDQFLVNPISSVLQWIPGIIGTSVNNRGVPMIVVDPNKMPRTRPIHLAENDKTKTKQENLIMVVDDSLTVRKVMERFLLREGYEVIMARDGAEAMQMLSDGQLPALMISDIEMPNMDGFELLAAIKQHSDYLSIPVFMISSRTAEKHKKHAFDLGALKFFGKPYREEDLLLNIRSYLGKRDAV